VLFFSELSLLIKNALNIITSYIIYIQNLLIKKMNALELKTILKKLSIICLFLAPLMAIPLLPLVYTNPPSITTQEYPEITVNQNLDESSVPKTAGIHLPTINSPDNIWRREDQKAHIDWIITDEDVKIGEQGGTYNITGDDGENIPQFEELPWYSGEVVPWEALIPVAVQDDFYTIIAEDFDGNKVNDTVNVEPWNEGDYPLLETVSFTQDGQEFSLNHDIRGDSTLTYKPYLECGKGAFDIKLEWENTNLQGLTPGDKLLDIRPNKIRDVYCELTAFYPNYDFSFYLPALGMELELTCDPYSTNNTYTFPIGFSRTLLSNGPCFPYWGSLTYKLLYSGPFGIPILNPLGLQQIAPWPFNWWHSLPSFSKSGHTYSLTPALSSVYTWRTWIWTEINPIFQQIFEKRVQDTVYGVNNILTLNVVTGNVPVFHDIDHEFIYDLQKENQFVSIDFNNRDTLAPSAEILSANQTDSDSNFEVICSVIDEDYGSGVNRDQIILYYSVDGGAYASDTMVLMDDGYFHGNIPPPPLGSVVEYYIELNDKAGNTVNTEIYEVYAEPYELPGVIIPIIGVLVVTIGAVAITLIYRKRNKPAIITLPSKKKVDKYYKKINKEEG